MLDLSKINKIYVIGIKGSGIIAIVEIMHSRGMKITGSDTSEKFFTTEILDRLGIPYFEKFDPKNIPSDADLIIYSTAYNASNNSEIAYAKEKGLTMVSYPEILSGLFNAKYGIAVCGTHGKTTTSAMLASILKNCRQDPLAAIGSKVIDWQSNVLVGNGEMFVAETDEYQNKLSQYDPKGVILTSCDFDHPDYFDNFKDYKKVFMDFVARIPKIGFLVVWGDSVDTLEIAKSANCKILTYGFSEECDIRIKLSEVYKTEDEDVHDLDEKMHSFVLYHGTQELGTFQIKLHGKHNILNATAAIGASYILNLNLDQAGEALRSFSGTSRRFEYVGKRNGAILIDDYAHHPEEIKATLKAAKDIYPEKNIWAIFHPHTYTRTKALLSEFSQSFDDADRVMVLDIYGSAREIQGGVHSQELVDLINKYTRGKAEYVPTINEAVKFLINEKIGKDDVIIAIGAGNVWEVVDKLKEK